MSDGPASLSATWPDGRPVEPGSDALNFLAHEARRLRENPNHLMRVVKRDDTAGRTILKLLGLTRDALRRPAHRPRDIRRHMLVLRLNQDIAEAESHQGSERDAALAKALAANGVLGNGRGQKPMSPKSAANAVRSAQTAMVQHYFKPIDGDVDTSAFEAAPPVGEEAS